MTTSESKIKLYNKLTIVLFSIFGSTLVGAIMYSMNLKAAGSKAKWIGPVLFAIVYHMVINGGIQRMGINIGFGVLLINAIGGMLLSYVFWNEQINSDIEYESRSIWPPLLIMLFAIAVLIGLNVITRL